MTLEPGDPAPTVTAQNQHGDEVTPSFDGVAVLYFYPADDTPGCTTEATEFTKERDAYLDADVAVYGVSVDGVDSHAAFAEKYDIEFDLLADTEGKIADAFDVERRDGGATARTTFVLVDGEVYDVYTGVDPSGHARTVLGDLLDDGVVELEA